MARTKLRCIAPDGVEHTRTTSRPYTHVVFGRPSYEVAIMRAQDQGADFRNFLYYSALAATEPGKTYGNHGWVVTEEMHQRGLQEVGEHDSAESYYAAKREERISRVTRDRLDGYYSRWQVIGWCGRYDLAIKKANAAGPYWAATEIREVQS